MAATVPWNKLPYMKKSVAQADPPKEASTFKRIKSPPHLLFSNKMAHYFVDWTTPSGLFKEIYYPYKKFDASNRSS